MTTREQLGLNANWIPMDSSKSGGSDEFLVKKVNQLEEKVNELDSLSFRSPIDEASKALLTVSIINKDSKVYAAINLSGGESSQKVKFRIDNDHYTITRNSSVNIEVPEVQDTKLAEYGVHAYYLNLILRDILVSGLSPLEVKTTGKQGNEFDRIEKTNPLTEYEDGSRELRAYREIKQLFWDSTKTVGIFRSGERARYNSSNTSIAKEFILQDTEENVFNIRNLDSRIAVIHPNMKSGVSTYEDASYTTRTKIRGFKAIKVLEVLDIGPVVKYVETELIWKSSEELLKDKLQPCMLISEIMKGVKKYGYDKDITGYPILVYAPNVRDCISYVYKTDLSEWLGYFSGGVGGMFIKNAKSVPRTVNIPFRYRNEDGYDRNITVHPIKDPSIYITPINVGGLDFVGYYKSKAVDLPNPYPEQDNAISGLSYRGHVGLTHKDFEDNKSIEVWTFTQRAINTNNIYTNIQAVSSLINKDTGEFITAHTDYQKWKTNKCVIHQTLQKVGQEVKVVNIELTTLDVFFKTFIAKSEEWKTRNPSKVEVEGGNPKGNFDKVWTWDEYYDRL